MGCCAQAAEERPGPGTRVRICIANGRLRDRGSGPRQVARNGRHSRRRHHRALAVNGRIPAVRQQPHRRRLPQVLEQAQWETTGRALSRGDMRCLLFGHLARLAVWVLHPDWDVGPPPERKLSAMDSYATPAPAVGSPSRAARTPVTRYPRRAAWCQ